jgi:hypothetical protein
MPWLWFVMLIDEMGMFFDKAAYVIRSVIWWIKCVIGIELVRDQR